MPLLLHWEAYIGRDAYGLQKTAIVYVFENSDKPMLNEEQGKSELNNCHSAWEQMEGEQRKIESFRDGAKEQKEMRSGRQRASR